MASKTATIKAVVLGDVDDFKKSMTQVGESAEEAGDKVKRDLGAGMDSLGEGAGGAEQKFIGLSDSISGTQDVMGGLQSGNVQQLAMGMADLSGAVEMLWSSVGKAIIGLWKKVAAMYAEAAAAGTSTVALIGHKIATIASEVATKAWAAAQWVLNAALNANPVMLVVIAIAALVAAAYLAYQNIGWFRDAVDAVARFLRDDLWPVLQDVGAWLGTVFVAAWDGARAAVGWLIDAGQVLWAMFSDYVLPVLLAVGEFVGGAIVAYFKAGMTAIGWLIDAGLWLWRVFANNVFPALQTVAGWVGTYFVAQFDVARTAVGWVVDRFQDVWNKAVAVKDGVIAAFGQLGDWFNWLRDMATWMKDSVVVVFDSLVDFFWGIPGRIGDALAGMWDYVPSMPDFTPGFDVPGVPAFAAGGLVRGGRGGVLGVIGEGAHDELIVPLDRAGGASGLGTTINNITVVASVGSSPRDIGRELTRCLNEYQRAEG